MDQALRKAKLAHEDAEKAWAKAQKHMETIAEMDLRSSEYYILMARLEAIQGLLKEGNNSLQGLKEDLDSLRLTVPDGARKSSTGAICQREPAQFVDDEPPRRRQRTQSPEFPTPPRAGRALTVSESRPMHGGMAPPPSQPRTQRAPTVEATPEPELYIAQTQTQTQTRAQTQTQTQAPSQVELTTQVDFSAFEPALPVGVNGRSRDEQLAAFFRLCYAHPPLTQSEILRGVKQLSFKQDLQLQEVINATTRVAIGDTPARCVVSNIIKRKAMIPLAANGELLSSNCPGCAQYDADSAFCFHLELVPGVYVPPKGRKQSFDYTAVPMVLSVSGQLHKKRYKLIRHPATPTVIDDS